MRKIEKDLSVFAIPESLRLPIPQNFENERVKGPSKTTHSRRLEIIREGKYSNTKKHNSRYKLRDVKDALSTLYHGKCAYCEQRVEQFHVEHYRPKTIYFWLAYSWDNLLLACVTCNQLKLDSFPINGSIASLDEAQFLQNINSIGAEYDSIELPKIANPERHNPEGKLDFKKDGSLASNDPIFKGTIENLKLYRKHLCDERKKILEELRADFESQFAGHETHQAQMNGIRLVLEKFKKNLQNDKSEFIAFRKFILQHWLAEELNAAIK